MVFGSIASSSSWELFCCAIEAMSIVYANRPDLVIKHKRCLDMINRADIDPSVELTKAVAFSTNKVVLDNQGVAQPRLATIFVENSLLFAISQLLMKMALAALIETIFVVMGEPDTAIRSWEWGEAMETPFSALDESRLQRSTIEKGRFNTFYEYKHSTFVSRRKIFLERKDCRKRKDFGKGYLESSIFESSKSKRESALNQ
jgi:hypothetical protein